MTSPTRPSTSKPPRHRHAGSDEAQTGPLEQRNRVNHLGAAHCRYVQMVELRADSEENGIKAASRFFREHIRNPVLS
jgi:hypothetical protein